MPIVTAPISNLVAFFEVGISKAASLSDPEKPKSVRILAAVDTGAMMPLIPQDVVEKLALKSVGIQECETAIGEDKLDVYLVDITLRALQDGIEAECVFCDVSVIAGALDVGLFSMDLIAKGILNVDGPSKLVTFSI
ncbi:MAG TPA: hypothetical protein VGF56_16870 [Rhizomicrobium sp.]|jgi:hypothetical protein